VRSQSNNTVEIEALELRIQNECSNMLDFDNKRAVIRQKVLYVFNNLVGAFDVGEYATRNDQV